MTDSTGPGTLGLSERTARELQALAARLGERRTAALLDAIRATGEVEPVARGLLRIQQALRGRSRGGGARHPAGAGERVHPAAPPAATGASPLGASQRQHAVYRSTSRRSRPAGQRSSGVATAMGTDELARRLRRFKAGQSLRLAARDAWLGLPMETLGREQTALAEALLRAALLALEAPPAAALRRPRPGGLRGARPGQARRRGPQLELGHRPGAGAPRATG